ncbi:MAG: FRG domain-containing protein, partial [Planctomycetes bacterium]|nr:FRG domain-containing protein [Planctomycetota bacterium]
MPAEEVQVDTWFELTQHFQTFARLPQQVQKRFVFRGQADASWVLETTLDRVRNRETLGDRGELRSLLIQEFRRLAAGLGVDLTGVQSEGDWEMLGRHHGLPTAILDWTTSPYIAAFFALSERPDREPEGAAVWVLDRGVFLDNPLPELQLVDREDATAFNPRAIEQRAVFLKVESASVPVEDLLSDALMKYVLPRSERPVVLADLDASL